MNTRKKTRWQVRVEKELEKKIRELAEKEHRSINKTIIYICEKYFENIGNKPPLDK